MKKHTILVWGVLCCFQLSAQNLPKWMEKARKAVFSIVTYKDNKILGNGNGFFIGEDGTGVSDYTLFNGADRAVIISSDGKEMPVQWILGANDMYDVVKFRVATSKKTPALDILPRGASQGATVYLLPYSTQKTTTSSSGKVIQIDSIANNALYYTLDLPTTEKHVSCPVMSPEGQVIGMIQHNADKGQPKSFAIGIGYAKELNITALSANDTALKHIGIPTPLPSDETQAQVYLYLSASQLQGEAYLSLINRYIQQFPSSPDGYLQRATYYMSLNAAADQKKVEEDLKKAADITKNKAETHYNIAKSMYNYLAGAGEAKAYRSWNYDLPLQEINTAIAAGDNAVYHQVKGDILFAKADYKAAAAEYRIVNTSSLVAPASYYAEAKAIEMAGEDKKTALALLDSAVVHYAKPYGKEAAPYLFERSQLRADLKMYREAVADLNDFHSAMLGQVNAEFYYVRAQAEMQCRMYQQAIDDINKATEMTPGNAAYWLEKGGIHLRVNQLEEADKALAKALSLDGKDAAAWRMQGYIRLQQGKKKEGLELLEKAKSMGDTVAQGLIEKYSK